LPTRDRLQYIVGGLVVGEAQLAQRERSTFPFSAIVGQEDLKTALLLNAVDPLVGGVLIRGEKGTAKSTAVRALPRVLPQIGVARDCAYSCDPLDRETWCDSCRDHARSAPLTSARRRVSVVDLPISATEDRLVGTLDLGHALKHGERVFEPGLLAAANRGILYVDEVNLLDDHLVDTLLDAAAMGVNIVEREGVAHSHPARFVLVGTMNPEEGDVRPQLLDRFGLCVDVEGLSDPLARVEVVRRRRAFDDDPEGYAASWAAEDAALETRVEKARDSLPAVVLEDETLLLVSAICARFGVDGHRADLTMARAATAHAALAGRPAVSELDLAAVAPMVLAHRMRSRPFEEASYDHDLVEEILAGGVDGDDGAQPDSPEGRGSEAASVGFRADSAAAAEAPTEPLEDALAADLDRRRRTTAGRRDVARSDEPRGRYVRAEPRREGEPMDIALDATVREAAVHQRERDGDMAVTVRSEDVRNKVRERRVGASIVFCVDASGSMGATSRMSMAKTAILELLVDAYQRRDRVGLVSFRGEGADVVLPPTTSVELAQVKLRALPTGGATPLAQGIRTSLEVLSGETRRDADLVPWMVLVTDGRANVGIDGGLGSEDARLWAARAKAAEVRSLVIDTDTDDSPIAAARELARLSGGDYVRLGRLEGRSMATAIRTRVLATPS
jgi:magnesium chelatase subunit D